MPRRWCWLIGWAASRAGVVANVVVPDPGLRALRHPLRVPARLLRGRRPRVQGRGRGALSLRPARPGRPGRALGERDRGERRRAGPGAPRSTAAVHSEIAAVPSRAAGRASAAVLRPLPSLRPPLRRGEARKVDKLSTVRFGSARYSVPTRAGRPDRRGDRRRGQVADRSRRARSSPGTGWSPRARCRSSTSTTADPGGRPARAVRARSGSERAFLRPGPGRRGVPPRRRGGRGAPAGTELAAHRRPRSGLGP